MDTDSRVLVLNAGSSTLKFAVLNSVSGEADLSGTGDALGAAEPLVEWRSNGAKQVYRLQPGEDHQVVIDYLVDTVLSSRPELRRKLVAVGHRVVHGGDRFSSSVRVNPEVLQAIDDCSALAPLHNPPGLLGIRAAQRCFPDLPQVAVFDTAFHQTLPQHAYLYALPLRLYREHRLRRYGMHGCSYQFVCERAAQLLQRPLADVNIIAAHLGNGASVTAIAGGCSLDTSMGLTPLEGLVMGTRCGDIDPGLLLHLSRSLNYSIEGLDQLLNRESGLLGLSGLSNDCRTIEEAAGNGHDDARLALEIFCYRLAKYMASYTVPLQRVDALVFTGGIGENSSRVRAAVLNHLHHLGYRLDDNLNENTRGRAEGAISTTGSPLVLVIPTNEEWVIARDAATLATEAGD